MIVRIYKKTSLSSCNGSLGVGKLTAINAPKPPKVKMMNLAMTVVSGDENESMYFTAGR